MSSFARGWPRTLHPGALEQRSGLFQAAPQTVRADLGELRLQPQPVQAQTQIPQGGQHEPLLRRRAHQQQFQLSLRLRRAQLVQVVDDQPDWIRQRCEVLQQPLHHPGTVPPSTASRPPLARDCARLLARAAHGGRAASATAHEAAPCTPRPARQPETPPADGRRQLARAPPASVHVSQHPASVAFRGPGRRAWGVTGEDDASLYG